MTTPESPSPRRPALGAVVIAVSVLGALFAGALLVVPPAVEPQVWSYPLSTAPYVAGQVFVALHHLVLAAGLFVAWRIGLAGRTRLAAIGGVSSSIAMALFAGIELLSAGAADQVGSTELVSLLGSLYGGGTAVLAITSIIFGIAILRAHAWTGLTRVTVLVSGIYLFVPMIPAQFDPLFWGRVAVGVWSLLYIGLGIGLRRGAATPQP